MNLDKLKSKYLGNRSQFILLGTKGQIIESCDSLFRAAPGILAFEISPFLESVKDVVISLEKDDSIDYPSIQTEFFARKGYYDLSFHRLSRDRILWISIDQTDFYSSVIPIQQERNELDIREEFLKIRQKAITLEKRLLRLQNEELKRVKKFKEDFFAQVSHEMRVPLNSILGLAKLINDNNPSGKDTEQSTALINTSQHLASVVDDVLELSRMEAGKTSIDLVDFQLQETIDSVLNSFAYSVSSKKISLVSQINADVPRNLTGDCKKLSQILFNLIGNAVKYTHKGSVQLRVSRYPDDQSEGLSFEVSDTGIGIPHKDLTSIFQPYARGKGANSKLYGGTGLGLSIVKKLAEIQGGAVNIKSKKGQGTTVTVDLPIKTAKDKSEVKGKKKQDFKPMVHLRSVLVGEDDQLNQKVVSDWLVKWGMKPTCGADASAIRKHLRTGGYDLCILDYQLPDGTGLQIAEELATKLPPTILLTGRAIPKSVAKKSTRFEAILLKPFDPHHLYKAIKNIDNRKALKEADTIDLTNLRKITNNNVVLMVELVEIFNDTVPQLIQEMKKDLEIQDWKKLQKAIHRIAPNLEYVGSTQVVQVLDDLEGKVKGRKTPKKIEEQLMKLETYTNRMIVELSHTNIELA